LAIIEIQIQRITILDKHDPMLYSFDVKAKIASAVSTIAEIPNNSHS